MFRLLVGQVKVGLPTRLSHFRSGEMQAGSGLDWGYMANPPYRSEFAWDGRAETSYGESAGDDQFFHRSIWRIILPGLVAANASTAKQPCAMATFPKPSCGALQG